MLGQTYFIYNPIILNKVDMLNKNATNRENHNMVERVADVVQVWSTIIIFFIKRIIFVTGYIYISLVGGSLTLKRVGSRNA